MVTRKNNSSVYNFSNIFLPKSYRTAKLGRPNPLRVVSPQTKILYTPTTHIENLSLFSNIYNKYKHFPWTGKYKYFYGPILGEENERVIICFSWKIYTDCEGRRRDEVFTSNGYFNILLFTT